MPLSPRLGATLLGALAILFWSASVGLTRDLAGRLGVLTSSALVYGIAGLLGCAVMAARGRLRPLLRLPRAYLVGCGTLFVAYLVSFCLAIGLAKDGVQVVEVGLVNYLWPSLTLVLSVPILGHRARYWLLVPGMLAACLGIFLGSLADRPLGPGAVSDALATLGAHLAADPAPYLLALVAAVTWSLYSNLSRRLARDAAGSAVPLFLLVSGLALLAARAFFTESSVLDARAATELGFMILFPALAAYSFWEHAMRRGHLVAVAALSYFTPLLSTVILCQLQDLPMRPALWLACALIIAGAAVCKLGVGERKG